MNKIILVEGATLLDIVHVCCDLIQEDREQFEAFTGTPWDLDRAAVNYFNLPGPKFTAVLGGVVGHPVVVGGYTPVRPGVYASWFLSTPQAWAAGLGVTRVTRGVIRGMLQNGAHRLETVCLASRAQTRAWYETIGLRYETTMQKFGVKGQDAAIYVATGEVAV